MSEGFSYSLWKADNMVGELTAAGVKVEAVALESGLNEFSIKAMNSCGSSFHVGNINVNKVGLIIPQALGGQTCGSGQCILKAETNDEVAGFVWYESATSSVPISYDAMFTTPTLDKSRQYYVAALNKAGCEGERVAVAAQVIHVDPVISQEGAIFKSSYEEGNQWYKDGQLLVGATQSEYAPYASGSYTVSVTNKGCTSLSMARIFSINSADLKEMPDLSAFPNPTIDVLQINAAAHTGYRFVHVTNADGKVLSSVSLKSSEGRITGIIDLKGRPAGMYYLKFQGTRGVTVTKVVKL